MTTITIPTDAADLAAQHGIDPEAVALSAVADAIEAAVLRAADEAANAVASMSVGPDGVWQIHTANEASLSFLTARWQTLAAWPTSLSGVAA